MLAVTVIAGILFVWSLLALRLSRWSITAPIAMMAAGIALTAGSDPPLRFELETTAFEHAVEVILALLLFVDAIEVPGRIMGREKNIVLRLLGGGLPLTLCAAFLSGLLLFPGQSGWLLAVLATVVVPLDLAPTASVVRDRRIPARLREVLNVEGGLNDGIVSPVFLLCVAAAVESHDVRSDYGEALLTAVDAAGWALATGLFVGWTAGWLLRTSWSRGWTQTHAMRLGVLAVPLVAYTFSSAVGGNGFVAAFIAGVVFGPAVQELPASAVELTDDLVTLLSLALWFVFGQIVNNAFWPGFQTTVVLYALLAVTLVRMVPVLLVLMGAGMSRTDKLFLGWMGPRGVTSVVFGSLAVIELPDASADFVSRVMVVTVMLSIVLHGLSAEPIARYYARRTEKPRPAAPAAGAGP
ncbi:cation:proton antiporter domain-containing protein [Streptomyces tirandamycinicus]|uniref:cation:proton antiporter domain-containing protein n=1 Tax=Streptomyces tirandamycinicus TaxID=2174846 RepID=UPI00226FC7F6|nr:cation:proton antiporter [Streptomyces tirandamycinicus]MCY0981066.1 cation:proton antiporter [Streptomyces tirandamycinicus]